MKKCGTQYLLMQKVAASRSEVAFIPLLCKSWSCETCRPKKAEIVRAFIRKSFIGKKVWMMTFTFYHSGTALDAWKKIGSCVNRMLTYARLHCGAFDYIRVVEPHKDGSWPHVHLLSTVPFSDTTFVKLVTDWGFGWNFHCAPIDALKASNYVSKYLTKPWPEGDADLLRQISKTRIVSCSRSLGSIFSKPSNWKLIPLSNPFRQIPYLRTAVIAELTDQGATVIEVKTIAEGFHIKADASLSSEFVDFLSDPFLFDSCDALHEAYLDAAQARATPF
jgi:hypothetical protein